MNTRPSPTVRYAYTEMASSANHSRLKSMTYPNGRILRYEYSTGLDADISRVSYHADDSSGSVGTHLEEYSYLEQSTIVERKYPEPSLDLSFVKQSGESTLASGTITDGNATWAQQWDNTGSTGSGYDALGNWKAVTTDTNGGTAGGATTETRTHNDQNQITTVSGATSPVYDDACSMTTDETGQQYTYDAWGRTVKVKDSSGNEKVVYTLDALGRRVKEDVNSTYGTGSDTELYYSAGWQVIEERQGGSTKYQNVWSLAYIDALAVRDDVATGDRYYIVQDANSLVSFRN